MSDKITFFRDANNTFNCQIKIEGAALNESKARLLLSFDNGITVLFNGSINKNGVCEVVVPALKEFKQTKGNAVLEVIADSTYFESWHAPFDVKTKKNVTVVSEAVVTSTSDKKSIIVNISSSKPKKSVMKERKRDSFLSLISDSCEVNDIVKVRRMLKGFNTLDSNKKHVLITELKRYTPSKKIDRWAKKTFSDPTSMVAKYCMKLIESKL